MKLKKWRRSWETLPFIAHVNAFEQPPFRFGFPPVPATSKSRWGDHFMGSVSQTACICCVVSLIEGRSVRSSLIVLKRTKKNGSIPFLYTYITWYLLICILLDRRFSFAKSKSAIRIALSDRMHVSTSRFSATRQNSRHVDTSWPCVFIFP